MDPLDVALAVAREAGDLLTEAYGRRHAAVRKRTDIDLVTEYDERSEALIVERLHAAFPGDLIVGEEGGERGQASSARWYVDPIDGTTNFAHGLPIFCVSIAREVDGVLQCGVTHAPILGLTFAARRGGGAVCNGAPLRVSDEGTLKGALLSTGFPYDRHTAAEANLEQFVAFKRRAQGVRRLGSAALDLAFVARGSLDGFWEMKLKPWDMAVGALLVEEAGGRVTGWSGEPISLELGAVVASNGPLHEPMLAVLRQVGIPAAAG